MIKTLEEFMININVYLYTLDIKNPTVENYDIKQMYDGNNKIFYQKTLNNYTTLVINRIGIPYTSLVIRTTRKFRDKLKIFYNNPKIKIYYNINHSSCFPVEYNMTIDENTNIKIPILVKYKVFEKKKYKVYKDYDNKLFSAKYLQAP